MSTTATVTPEDALSIFTVQDEQGQVDATVPVRWCISQETAEMLQKAGVRDPQVVIVVEHDGNEMDRYVVPLEKEMRYIQFRRPGNNVIHATIMWPAGFGSVKKKVTDRNDSGVYRMKLLTKSRPGVERLDKQYDELANQRFRLVQNDEAESDEAVALLNQMESLSVELDKAREMEPYQTHMRDRLDAVHCIGNEAELGVVVPDEMFAKKPPRWMNWLGKFYDGLFWNRDARDQCELRRRALITLPTMPFALAIALLLAIGIELFQLAAVGVLLLFGMRNLDFGPLRHPFDLWPPSDIWIHMEKSVWWYKKEDTEYRHSRYTLRHPVLTVVNPPMVVVFGLIGLTLYLTLGPLVFLFLGLGSVFVAGLLISIINIAAKGPLARMAADVKVRRERMEEEQKKRDREELRKELEQLACTSAAREVSLSALPKERRTIALRFQAIKVKVCRPFARA